MPRKENEAAKSFSNSTNDIALMDLHRQIFSPGRATLRGAVEFFCRLDRVSPYRLWNYP